MEVDESAEMEYDLNEVLASLKPDGWQSALHTQSATNEISKVLLEMSNEMDPNFVDAIKIHLEVVLDISPIEVNHLREPKHLFSALLRRFAGNYKAMLITLYDAMMSTDYPGRVSGYWTKVVEKYKELRDSIMGQDRNAGAIMELYGRDKDLKKLSDFLGTGESDRRVLNVCGMAGIGKSWLIKNLLWRADAYTCFLVDCRDLELDGILDRLITKMDPETGGGTDDLRSAVLRQLADRSDESIIVALDDISISSNNEVERKKSAEILEFILQIINSQKLLKVIVTTREVMSDSGEESLTRLQASLERHVYNYELNRIDDRDALRFLGYDENSGSTPERYMERLVAACHGHPYSLALLRLYGANSAEFLNSRISRSDLTSEIQHIMGNLYHNHYEQLPEHQKTFLKLLALFPGGTKLKHMYRILNPSGSDLLDFCNSAMTEFGPTFWVDIRVPETANVKFTEKKADHRVAFHHPTVQDFIRCQLDKEETRRQNLVSSFINYHLEIVIRLGKDCITKVKPTSTELSRQRNAITAMLRLLTIDVRFMSIFSNLNEHDLSYLLIFIDVHFDIFQKSFALLAEAIDSSLQSFCEKLTMISIALSQQQSNYVRMEHLLSECNRYQVHSSAFMKAMFNYHKGCLFIFGRKFTENKQRISEALMALGLGRNFMKVVGGANLSVEQEVQSYKRYWRVVFFAASASASFRLAQIDYTVPTLLTKAVAFILEAEKENARFSVGETGSRQSSQVATSASPSVLTPRLLRQKNIYISTQGHREIDHLKATEKYTEAEHYLAKERKLLTSWRREDGTESATNHQSRAILLKSWANMKAEIPARTVSINASIISLFREALQQCKPALDIFKRLGQDFLPDRVRTHVTMAEIYERLVYEYRGSSALLDKYKVNAFKHYKMGYNILKEQHHLCNISSTLWWFERIQQRLPVIMEGTEQPVERIEKVKYNLERIAHEADREAGEECSLSGSDLSAWSDIFQSEWDAIRTSSPPASPPNDQSAPPTKRSKFDSAS